MKKILTLSACCFAFLLDNAPAVEFYPIAAVESSTAADDLWPASNLIQGPGVGFDANEPHDKTLGGADGNWVTAAPGGFPSDYIAVAGMPVISLDLGEDRVLSEISVWGYESTNSNGVSEFTLNFATDAEGAGGGSASAGPFATAGDLNTGMNDSTTRQSFSFDAVTARYVDVTVTDNFFNSDGTDAGGNIPGGDRAGLGEIAFAIPEPNSMLMLVPALALLFRFRRR